MRIFKAETPHDVVCAALVARALPVDGTTTLAWSSQKAFGDRRQFVLAMHATIAAYPWDTVIELPALPIATPQRRHRSALSLKESVEALRETLGDAGTNARRL